MSGFGTERHRLACSGCRVSDECGRDSEVQVRHPSRRSRCHSHEPQDIGPAVLHRRADGRPGRRRLRNVDNEALQKNIAPATLTRIAEASARQARKHEPFLRRHQRLARPWAEEGYLERNRHGGRMPYRGHVDVAAARHREAHHHTMRARAVSFATIGMGRSRSLEVHAMFARVTRASSSHTTEAAHKSYGSFFHTHRARPKRKCGSSGSCWPMDARQHQH